MRLTKLTLILLIFATMFMLQGCGVKKIQMPDYTEAQPLDIPPTAKLKPIGFAKAVVNIRRGTRIGALYGGPSGNGSVCNHNSSRYLDWATGRTIMGGRDGEYAEYFQEAMSSAGYNAVGNSSVLFDREKELSKAEYQVAARILDIQTNLCHEIDLWNARALGTTLGELNITVEWSVYSNFKQKVVFTTKNSGYYKLEKGAGGGAGILYYEAFASAAQNLAANPEFYALVSEKKNSYADVPKTVGEMVSIDNAEVSNEPIKTHLSDVLSAVVLIHIGSGHGSGFLVSPDGYIITNAHVVGDSERLPVKFSGGFELVGKVIKKDEIRDVALIKVELSNSKALPLLPELPKVTDEAYAIGAPLYKDLEATTTKGVISAIRYDKTHQCNVIQGDVPILPGNSGGPLVDSNGNVIGISTFGRITSSGEMKHLNFFIPINVAMEVLNIKKQN